MENLLNITELAQALKVSESTIYYWTSRTEIPFLKVGRHLRFDLEAVKQAFADRTQNEIARMPRGRAINRACSLKTRDVSRIKPPDEEE